MSATGLEVLDETVQQTYRWINELDRSLGWQDRHRSLRLLRAVLHAVRDCLPVAENAQLAAQMPALLRGLYFEQWRPGHVEPRRRTRERFVRRIEEAFPNDPLFDAAGEARAVFALLSLKISTGEIEDVIACLPQHIRDLWTGSLAVASDQEC
ncbi:MAG TPA: DUF2267 domain-containing protein [Rhizomicrobium sp.]|nr:DUF2267 domain-containing protein [Rhizomicrobium sp.]